MKKILVLTFIIGFIGCSEMVDPPKYEYGDCITQQTLMLLGMESMQK